MSHPIPDDTIARWRKLADAATPGPWKRYEASGAIDGEAGVLVAQGTWPGTGDFIAEARSALPALLDEVARLREESRRLEDERDEAKRDAALQKRRADANFADYAGMRDHANEIARKADADSGRAGAEIRRLEEEVQSLRGRIVPAPEARPCPDPSL